MATNASLLQRSFWLKFAEILCLLFVVTGIVQFNTVVSTLEYQFASDKTKMLTAAAVMIAISLLVAFFWQKRNKGQAIHSWLQGIIIFYVVYAICMYGFAKLLKTQFQPPQYVMDMPIKDLGGFWLTWVYYGHSQTLAYILGATQIGGSILLLFRKTRLPGVFILLPVMVNIILVNHFYDISALAYFNSVHYTIILLFLLLLDYDKLKIIFSSAGTLSLNFKTVLLNVARVLVLMLAFLDVWSLKHQFAPKSKLNGKWQVQSLAKNNIIAKPADYTDSLFSIVYFEWRYGCLFRYNANKFEDKDLYGDYKADEKQQTVLISLYKEDGKPDSAFFHYQFSTDSLLRLVGNYKSDSMTMNLKRLK